MSFYNMYESHFLSTLILQLMHWLLHSQYMQIPILTVLVLGWSLFEGPKAMNVGFL